MDADQLIHVTKRAIERAAPARELQGAQRSSAYRIVEHSDHIQMKCSRTGSSPQINRMDEGERPSGLIYLCWHEIRSLQYVVEIDGCAIPLPSHEVLRQQDRQSLALPRQIPRDTLAHAVRKRFNPFQLSADLHCVAASVMHPPILLVSLFIRLSTGCGLTLPLCHPSCLHPIAIKNRWFTVRTAEYQYPAMPTNGLRCHSWLSAKPAGAREPTDRLKCSLVLPCKFGSVPSTMNVYGSAYMERKREAHGKVVQMVLPRPNEKGCHWSGSLLTSPSRQSYCGFVWA